MKREEIIFMYILLIIIMMVCFFVFNREEQHFYRYEMKTLYNNTIAIVLDRYNGTTTLLKPKSTNLEYEAIDIDHNINIEQINLQTNIGYAMDSIFMTKIRKKYPQYNDIPDKELMEKIINKLDKLALEQKAKKLDLSSLNLEKE